MSQIIQVNHQVDRKIVFKVVAGIGDNVHLQPTIAKLLSLGYHNISIFTRPDSIGLYDSIDGVKEFSIDAITTYNAIADGATVIDINQALHADHSIHRSYKYAKHTFDALGIAFDENLGTPILQITDVERQWGKKYKDFDKCLFIQVDSSRETKCLNHDNIIALINSLRKTGWRIYYTANSQLNVRGCGVTWVRGLSIRQMMCLIANMDLVIAPDSSLGLISLALGIRTIMLWGATEPQLYGYNVPNCESYLPGVRCQVCGSNTCPEVICMKAFTSDMLSTYVKSPGIRRDYPQRRIHGTMYTPEAYPIIKKDSELKIACVVPNLFMGGAETQLHYLLKNNYFEFGEICVIQAYYETFAPPSPTMLDKLGSVATVYQNQSPDEIKREDIPDWVSGILMGFKPDIILHHGQTPIADIAHLLRPKPLMLQILHTADDNSRWGIGALEKAHKITDTVITVSEHIKNLYGNRYPCLKWQTILNGVPITNGEPTYRLPDDQFNVGILSRLTIDKGIEHVISSLQYLPNYVRLLIGGGGPKDQEFRQLTYPYGDRVRFYGEVADNYNFLASLDCFVLASNTEGNSMTILEAAMQKIPLVVTPVGAVPELFVNNESAKIIDPTPDAIAQAITELDSDVEQCVSLSNKAYDIVTKSSTDVMMASQYTDIIKQSTAIHRNPETIAVIRYGGAGDVMMTLPMVTHLRKTYPKAKIWYYTQAKHKCLLSSSLVDNVISILNMPDVVNFNIDRPTEYIDYHPFDIVIRCDHGEVWDNHIHICDWYLGLVGGVPGNRDMQLQGISLNSPAKSKTAVLQRYSTNSTRDWGRDSDWKAIEKKLKGYKILYLDGTYKGTPIDYWTSAKLIQKGRLFIGTDSVGLHLAHAVGTLAIGLYPATSPKICGYDDNINIVSDTKCEEYCYLQGGEDFHGVCPPHDHGIKCHEGIKLEQVLTAIDIATRRT